MVLPRNVPNTRIHDNDVRGFFRAVFDFVEDEFDFVRVTAGYEMIFQVYVVFLNEIREGKKEKVDGLAKVASKSILK